MKELADGFRRFAAKADSKFYSSLIAGQHPHTMMISCSDSRIIPEHIFDAKPGEIFVLRNVGNLARTEESSVRACIDYAVKHLKVERIAGEVYVPATVLPSRFKRLQCIAYLIKEGDGIAGCNTVQVHLANRIDVEF